MTGFQKDALDINFDFTIDSHGYWEGFWQRNNGLGAGGCDPDSTSPTLKMYHQLLWSKPLPNGDIMQLESDRYGYLRWHDMRFGSDSITASFRYRDYRPMIEAVANRLPDYRHFMESFLHKTYTIGGMIIFPRHRNSINQRRGTNKRIRDRWDLTWECIRRFYVGDGSPLSDVLEVDRRFFELFVDFKGYIDFFYLQDCVTKDYGQVRFWLKDNHFAENPFPQTVSEYLGFIQAELDFVEQRNARIKASLV